MTDTAQLLAQVRDRRDLPPPAMRRALRRAAGLSLAAVGASFDPPVTRSAVHQWESGGRRPQPPHLRQYAELLRALQQELHP